MGVHLGELFAHGWKKEGNVQMGKSMSPMRYILTILLFIFTYSIAQSDDNSNSLLGIWEAEDGSKLEFIDGFKPNSGAVISYDGGQERYIRNWSTDPKGQVLKSGWSEDHYIISNDGNIMQWGSSQLKRLSSASSTDVVELKIDPDHFVVELTQTNWANYVTGNMEFTPTFSNTEGVATQFDTEGILESLSSWGIASGALKIGGSVYLEARITSQHFMAMDADDNFIVFKRIGSREFNPPMDLAESRELFLAELTTGAWQTPSYSSPIISRFRPLEGDLKGLLFEEQLGALTSTNGWEFSVGTGAFKIGYAEYIGGLVSGDLLVFIDESGDQNPYYREPSAERRKFTSVDTRSIPLSERRIPDISELLSRQLSQGETFVLFEFNRDGRTGYVHEWTSKPFNITGETLEVNDYYSYNNLYLVEDYIALGEGGPGYKIDLRESRLKPKTDQEASSDARDAGNSLESLSEGVVKMILTLADGSVKTIKLPIESMEQIQSIEISSD